MPLVTKSNKTAKSLEKKTTLGRGAQRATKMGTERAVQILYPSSLKPTCWTARLRLVGQHPLRLDYQLMNKKTRRMAENAFMIVFSFLREHENREVSLTNLLNHSKEK